MLSDIWQYTTWLVAIYLKFILPVWWYCDFRALDVFKSAAPPEDHVSTVKIVVRCVANRIEPKSQKMGLYSIQRTLSVIIILLSSSSHLNSGTIAHSPVATYARTDVRVIGDMVPTPLSPGFNKPFLRLRGCVGKCCVLRAVILGKNPRGLLG